MISFWKISSSGPVACPMVLLCLSIVIAFEPSKRVGDAQRSMKTQCQADIRIGYQVWIDRSLRNGKHVKGVDWG